MGNKSLINVAVSGSMETDTGQKTSTLVAQVSSLEGINLKMVYNRDLKEAELILRTADVIDGYSCISSKKAADGINRKNIYTDCVDVLFDPGNIDILMVTDTDTETAVKVIYESLRNGINVINMNAVSEITLGLFFKELADSNNLIYTVGAGDEPAATLELIRFCSMLGLDVICAGKGKNNPLNIYCKPDDFSKKARQMGISPRSITSFVDGTKTMLEMAILSNATGYPIDINGMHGPNVDLIELIETFDLKKNGGILNSIPVIDYAIGDIAPGVFVIFTSKQKTIIEELNYLKMGKGPNFLLYKPYHLGNIESPLSIFDIMTDKRATLTVKDRLITSVVAKAKKDLKKGSVLDIIGGSDFFGFAIDHQEMKDKDYAPVGLVEKSLLKKDVKKDAVISFGDIECKKDSIVFKHY